MNIAGGYVWMRKVLRNMDEKQIIELFHDLKDIEAVSKIVRAGINFIADNDAKETEEKVESNEMNEQEEWKQQDDLQRHRDVSSEGKRLY